MTIPEDFWREEERCGYRVTAEMKAVWAVEMTLLERFDAVCRQHGLTYFAGGGTLLGAVRHGGFIPWDDDVDLFMPRRDYERLLAVGDVAFAPPCFSVRSQSAHTQARTKSNGTATPWFSCRASRAHPSFLTEALKRKPVSGAQTQNSMPHVS